MYLPVPKDGEGDLKSSLEDVFGVEIMDIRSRGNVAPNLRRVVVDLRAP